MFKVYESVVENAKHCRVLDMKKTGRRLMGLMTSSDHVSLCWISDTGEYYCSCDDFSSRFYLCKHLYCLVHLFTNYLIEVIKSEFQTVSD